MYVAPRRLFTSAALAIALLLTNGALIEVIQPLSASARFSPPKPPSRGTPGIGRGGGSRSCLPLEKLTNVVMLDNLNALAPEYRRENATHVWGYTTLEHPTLWFYVPFAMSGVSAIDLTLWDDDQERNDQAKMVQKIAVPVPANSGIVSVKLPTNKPGLENGKLYKWYFKVYGKCLEGGSVFVDGWIERTTVEASISSKLKQASSQEKAKLLAERGIWFDALSALAEQRLAQPSDSVVLAEWTRLLEDIDMQRLAGQPIVRAK